MVIFVYLSSLPVAHLSDALGICLVVTGIVHGYRTKLLKIPPGSLMRSAYSTFTRDLSLMPHPKDHYIFFSWPASVRLMGWLNTG